MLKKASEASTIFAMYNNNNNNHYYVSTAKNVFHET